MLYRFQLSFYRNMTIHLFILQSLVSASLYTRVKQGGGPENQRITYQDLHDQTHFLSQLFRGEFIFPTEGLDVNLSKTLSGLENDNVVKAIRSPTDSSAIEFVELSEKERETGRENFDFYCFLIWPFIEAAWLGCVSLFMLTPPLSSVSPHPSLDIKKVQDHAQLFGKTLYHQGDLSYFEAVNKETLKNAYTRFEEEGIVIVTKSKEKGGISTIRLADEWVPRRREGEGSIVAEGPLWAFAERISSSRREGKNRRDGKTVESRVLNLADVVGAPLWEEAALGNGEVEPQVLEKVKAKARTRRKSMVVAARL